MANTNLLTQHLLAVLNHTEFFFPKVKSWIFRKLFFKPRSKTSKSFFWKYWTYHPQLEHW